MNPSETQLRVMIDIIPAMKQSTKEPLRKRLSFVSDRVEPLPR